MFRARVNFAKRNFAGELSVTPPMKAALEEKMWFALFLAKAPRVVLAARAR